MRVERLVVARASRRYCHHALSLLSQHPEQRFEFVGSGVTAGYLAAFGILVQHAEARAKPAAPAASASRTSCCMEAISAGVASRSKSSPIT